MSAQPPLFATSLRSIIAAVGLGLLAASTLVALAVRYAPDGVFVTINGVLWLRLLPLAVISFVLGAGAGLSAYFSWKLVRRVLGADADHS